MSSTGDEDLKPKTGGKGNLVEHFEVGWIGGSDPELTSGESQGNHPVLLRGGFWQRVQGVARNRVERAGIDRRNAQLRTEKLGQSLLGQESQLDQIGAQPASVELLRPKAFGELVLGDHRVFDQQLTEFDRHGRSGQG